MLAVALVVAWSFGVMMVAAKFSAEGDVAATVFLVGFAFWSLAAFAYLESHLERRK